MLSDAVLNPLVGGVLIGLAATGMLLTNGRVMGVSGILGGLINKKSSGKGWRLFFLLGLLFGGALIAPLGYSIMELPFERGLPFAVIGGLLVGFGTSLGSGCTSGHGVCGISRMSLRSILATIVFIVFGVVAVEIIKWLGGQ